MTVWIVESDLSKKVHYDLLSVKDNQQLPPLRGEPLSDIWEEPELIFSREDKRKLEVADFPFFSVRALACNNNVWLALQDLIGTEVENLPLNNVEGSRYWALNVTNFVDCLTHKSEFEYLRSNGNIVDIKKYDFDYGKLEETKLFRLLEKRLHTYCTDTFKNFVEQGKFTGLKFVSTT